MDELELLKKDWNKSEGKFKEFSDTEIYPMIHKKSSSIVKTIYYISIAELVFWILINTVPYIISPKFRMHLEEMTHSTLFVVLSVLGYIIIGLFVYLLYRSYTTISVTDSAKKLMESILRTRRIIKYYVIYNLSIAFISVPVSFYITLKENKEFAEQVANMNDSQMLFLVGIVVATTAVFIIVFWLFYRLLYGILLKRLNRNYRELKKLEV